MTKHPQAQLTKVFLERADQTGLTDSALAAAIGVSRQFYSSVKIGHEQPSVAFMAGAIRAGLAGTFAEVAEPIAREDLAA